MKMHTAVQQWKARRGSRYSNYGISSGSLDEFLFQTIYLFLYVRSLRKISQCTVNITCMLIIIIITKKPCFDAETNRNAGDKTEMYC